MAPKAAPSDATAALFITVRYAYEQECMFAVDCPCAMLLARIIKKCSFKFPEMPEIVKYDLKGHEDGVLAGIAELGLDRANESGLGARKVYDFVGFDCESQHLM